MNFHEICNAFASADSGMGTLILNEQTKFSWRPPNRFVLSDMKNPVGRWKLYLLGSWVEDPVLGSYCNNPCHSTRWRRSCYAWRCPCRRSAGRVASGEAVFERSYNAIFKFKSYSLDWTIFAYLICIIYYIVKEIKSPSSSSSSSSPHTHDHSTSLAVVRVFKTSGYDNNHWSRWWSSKSWCYDCTRVAYTHIITLLTLLSFRTIGCLVSSSNSPKWIQAFSWTFSIVNKLWTRNDAAAWILANNSYGVWSQSYGYLTYLCCNIVYLFCLDVITAGFHA